MRTYTLRIPRRIRTVAIMLSLLLAIFVPSACSTGSTADPDDTRISVYVSFYPMFDFTSRIAGNHARVVNLIPSASEPHGWEPTAADIVSLERADLFIYSGAGMESWVDDILETLSNDELVVVEAAEGLPLLHGQHMDTPGESDVDPHVWLSPVNAKLQMKNILDGLILADPENRDAYTDNFNQQTVLFDDLDTEFRNALAPYTGAEVIVAHEAFGYLCDAYGLVQVPVEGLTPDSEPDPARIADIIRFAESHQVRVIFFEETASSRVADTIADAIGAETGVLSPVAALDEAALTTGEDYLTVMRDNLQALVAALAAPDDSTG